MNEPSLSEKYSKDPLSWWPFAALAALFCLVYGWGDYSEITKWGDVATLPTQEKLSTFGFLIRRWLTDDSVTHGWLVIPIALAVTWTKREKLARIPLSSHIGGLYLIALALLMHLFEKALDINRPSPISIPIFVTGAVWYLAGTAWLKELSFPIAYLFFFVPVPGGLTTVVTTPLRIIATKGAHFITSHLGVQIFASGVHLDFFRPGLPNTEENHIRLDIADACSGIHSIMAIKALHAITAYLSRLRLKWKWVLFWLALPITTASNVIRITLLVLVAAYYNPHFALTYFHDKSPYPLFIIVFLLLVSIGRLMERLTKGEAYWKALKESEKKQVELEGAVKPWRREGKMPNLVKPAILLGVATILTGYFWARPTQMAEGADVTSIPKQVGDWQAVYDMQDSDEVMKEQSADSYLHRYYRRASDGMIIELLAVYRRYGRRDFAHRPDQCYPAAGFQITQQDATTLAWAGRQETARHLLANPGNAKLGNGDSYPAPMTTSYFFVSGNRSESDFLKQQIWMALERIFRNKNGWTFIRLQTTLIPQFPFEGFNKSPFAGKTFTDAEALAGQQDFMKAGEAEIRKVITTDPSTAGPEG
ncbi:MAG: EpsI family protein [Armatimonas sp.]